MVISTYIKCTICEKHYRLRVGVGFDHYQKHYFDCVDCEQPIVFALRAKAPDAWVEACENCLLSQPSEDELVMNFHPNCSFIPEQLHHPFAFPSMEYHRMIQPYMRLRPGRFQDIATQFDIPNAPDLWNKAKSIISLENQEGKDKALKKIINSYTAQRKKGNPDFNCTSGKEILAEFLDGVFYPRINDTLAPVIGLIEELDKESKLDEFYNYYDKELKTENLDRYLSVLSDYFRYRDHFGQLAFHARTYDEDVDDRIVSSKGFDYIKLYYGQVYEALTSNFTILACLNNVNKGRKFDTFEKMTLNKYINDVEKAKKHNPFNNDPIFNLFHEDLDSSLRNGSHHASIWREGEKVIYRSGGTGSKRDISYGRYIHICNKLTISLAALLLIEIHIQGKCS